MPRPRRGGVCGGLGGRLDFGEGGQGQGRHGPTHQVVVFAAQRLATSGLFGLRMLLVLRLEDFVATGCVLLQAAVLIAQLVAGGLGAGGGI